MAPSNDFVHSKPHLQVEVLYDEAVWALVGAEGGSLPDGGRLRPVRGLGQWLPSDVKAAS